jgi:DNA polymerase-4
MERAVLHVDMDNFFAAVEEKYNPALKSIPFAVCGDPEMRHSIVMAKNAHAKKLGIKTGISFAQARQIYPALGYVKADMPKYLAETKKARAVYLKYSNNLVPYGMDESWVELEQGTAPDEAGQIAEVIRIEIMYSLGLSASVGVSYNYIFSKLGSDMNKPNKTTVITRENYKDVVWALPASELLFVGSVRKKTLSGIGINTIGDIARAEPSRLGKLLGKVGYDLWRFANGDDRDFNPGNDKVESIGNTITPPEDLKTADDVSAVIYLLVSAISARLKKHRLKARCVSVCMRDSRFDKVIRQCRLSLPTDNVNKIFNNAYDLFSKHYRWNTPLRSIGVRVDNLGADEQLSLFENDECDLKFDIGNRIRGLTERLGKLDFEKTATTKEW